MPLTVLQLGTAGPLYGAERWILALMRALDPAQVTSHLVVIDDAPGQPLPLADAARALGLPVHVLPAPGRFDRRAAARLRTLAAALNADVLHSHGYKADLLALLAARGTTLRTVATPHGWSESADWRVRAYEAFDRLLLRHMDAVAPLSPDLAAGLMRDRRVAARLALIPNGVDLAEVDAARAAPPRRPPDAGDASVIGYVGQMIARKGVDTLLSAFAGRRRGDARLVLVGDGPDRPALMAQAQDLGIAERVHWTGFTPDRLAWMRGFDLFVLPSRREGIPRCLMEAMALGVPVAASDIPGNRDLVEPGMTGQMFAAGDAAGLMACMVALDQPNRIAAMAHAAERRVRERFSAAAMADGYARLFAQVAGR